jgi:CheY-like chemotaxis protein
MLSHELRNPLAAIRNAVSFLGMLGSADTRLVRARDIIDRQVAHLTRMVDDLLDASRLTRGVITLKRESVALADIVEGALEAVRPLIEQNEHTLSIQVPDEPILVSGDRARLIQVATNLLNNAAKFTPKGGHISIAVENVGMGATIRVRDTGIGISKDAQERIFQLFAQEETSLARSQGGLGIGLTLVKQIIELHGGRVEVESDGVDSGAELTVHLPVLSLPVLLAPDGSEAAEIATGSLRVLIVDDNVDSAESLRMLLEASGHVVTVVYDGVGALRVVEEFDPHVAFVDLGLPGIDGFEVARRILKHRRQPPVLIALSGYGREEDKQRTKAIGFHNHLVKPVDYQSVTNYLSTLGASALARDGSLRMH